MMSSLSCANPLQHYALEGLGINYSVVRAIDINENANKVYNLNFHNPVSTVSKRECLLVR